MNNELLPLGEVKELIKDPNYRWRDRANCLGVDVTSFIIDRDARGKKIEKIYAASLLIEMLEERRSRRSMRKLSPTVKTAMSKLSASHSLLNTNVWMVSGEIFCQIKEKDCTIIERCVTY